jgi:hypothetical protein
MVAVRCQQRDAGRVERQGEGEGRTKLRIADGSGEYEVKQEGTGQQAELAL